jgi:hypothetical protein
LIEAWYVLEAYRWNALQIFTAFEVRLLCKWCHQADARLKKGFLSNVLGAIVDGCSAVRRTAWLVAAVASASMLLSFTGGS